MTLIVRPLIGNGRFEVSGTDAEGVDGRTVLVSERWAAVLTLRAHEQNSAEYDELVRETYAPFTELADKARARIAALQGKDWSTITVTKATEGTPGEEITLDEDGTLLHILEQTGGSNMVWINGSLEARRS